MDSAQESDHRSNGKYLELSARAHGTSVNEQTLLATDYLNCINEICMLLEMLPDALDCFEDCRNWRLLTYNEHFQQSHIADAKLAMEAYPYSPPQSREAFETIISNIGNIISSAIQMLEIPIAAGQITSIEAITKDAVQRLHDNIGILGAIINGQSPDQDTVDNLLQNF